MHSRARSHNPFATITGIGLAGGIWRPGPLSLWQRIRVREPSNTAASPSLRPTPDGRGRNGKARQRCWTGLWGWWFTFGCLALLSLTSCRATVGRVIGQQFVSSAFAFEVPLPGDEWQPVSDEPSVLTLTHQYLAAGITISVTCDREADVPLNILTRHLFFGFKDMQILQQQPQALNGVPALKTIARARLDAREVQLYSYVAQRDGCVYDMVYFASPQDYPRGEPSFERMMAGLRFLQR
jgi:hypothetical protein